MDGVLSPVADVKDETTEIEPNLANTEFVREDNRTEEEVEEETEDDLEQEEEILGINLPTPFPTKKSYDLLPNTYWFHGPLKRIDAEKRLLDAANESEKSEGWYLVRESDRRPGNYVLSCVDDNETLLHYPITCLCGHYFLNGQEFGSLEHLVAFIISSCGLSFSRLTHPVPPPLPVVLSPRKVVATLPFCGMADSDELSFKKGDIFVVDQEMEEGWLWATNERTGLSGLVFQGLVDELTNCKTVPPEKLPYFYENVSLSTLARMLSEAGIDAFLVKPSDRSPGDLTLLLNTGIRVEKYLVKRTKDGDFVLGGRTFNSFHDIVDRYAQLEICDGHHLTTPVLTEETPQPDRLSMLKRLTCRNSCPEAAKAGLAWRKTKEQKKWKLVFLMLKEPEGQLFCFENERHTKPKSILDLCYCQLYLVHDSLFGRPNCFQLLLDGLDRTAFYFCVESLSDYQEWTRLLKPFCCGYQLESSPFSSIRTCTSTNSLKWRSLRSKIQLNLTVHEARNVSLKPDTECYCVVSINDAKISKTMTVPLSDECVIWEAEFCFDELPATSARSLLLSLHNKVKLRGRTKDSLIGVASVDDCCIGSKIDGRWLSPLANISKYSWTRSLYDSLTNWQIRLSLSLSEIHVMPEEEYSSLKELLIADDFFACHWLGQRVKVSDRSRLANALLDILSNNSNLYLKLVTAELAKEIEATIEPQTLFRSPTFCTSLMSCCLKRYGMLALTSALRPAVQEIISNKQILEIDKAKIDNQSVVYQNALQLVALTGDVCRRIYASVTEFSLPLRCILSNLKRKVAEKWTRDPIIKLRAVGSFVCLRFFCLALVDPRQFNLVNESVPRVAGRNLVLVAKLVQSLANLSPLTGYQEQDLEPIRLFADGAKEQMKNFLNEISSTCDEPKLDSTSSGSDVADDLAVIFEMALETVDKLQSETNTNEAFVKSMSAVIELLHSHQNMYLAHEPKIALI